LVFSLLISSVIVLSGSFQHQRHSLFVFTQPTCVFSDASGDYDLTGMKRLQPDGDFRFQKPGTNEVYYINICAQTFTFCASGNTASCQQAGSIVTSCGNLNQMSFDSIGGGRTGVVVKYSGGRSCEVPPYAPRSTEIVIECDRGAGQGTILEATEPSTCNYLLRMKSAIACPKGSDDTGGAGDGGDGQPNKGGLDGGWIFIIIFFVVIIVYVAGGILIRRKYYQAEGADAIPNYSFWSQLPGLAKDGVSFTISKIKGTS